MLTTLLMIKEMYTFFTDWGVPVVKYILTRLYVITQFKENPSDTLVIMEQFEDGRDLRGRVTLRYPPFP